MAIYLNQGVELSHSSVRKLETWPNRLSNKLVKAWLNLAQFVLGENVQKTTEIKNKIGWRYFVFFPHFALFF